MIRPMQYLLGIDGGGTHTRAILLTRRGRVLGIGIAGSSNYHNMGVPRAAKNLRKAADAAFGEAGLAPTPASAAYLGLSGVKASGDISRMRAAAEAIWLAEPGRVEVANDLHNALSGGLNGAEGIALIAGTGSNCLGRDASGATAMVGGWGWLLDDMGAGFGLAVAALRYAARAADGRRPATQILPSALAFFGLPEPDALLERLYTGEWQPSAVAEFAPVVIRLAGEGDGAALQLLQEGAAALAELVAGTARRLSFPRTARVVVLGGCARSGPPYQPLVEQAIRQSSPKLRICEPVHDPVHGAALNVLRMTGFKMDKELKLPTK